MCVPSSLFDSWQLSGEVVGLWGFFFFDKVFQKRFAIIFSLGLRESDWSKVSHLASCLQWEKNSENQLLIYHYTKLALPKEANTSKLLCFSSESAHFIHCVKIKGYWNFVVVQLRSHIRLFTSPWTIARQAPPSSIVSRSFLKFWNLHWNLHYPYCVLALKYHPLCPLYWYTKSFPFYK